MRLKVGEWISSWLCSETGVRTTTAASGDPADNFKLVLAEPLSDGRSDSQASLFLRAHGGPGLQHVGLAAGDDIAATVAEMAGRGARFRRPPPTYYKLVWISSFKANVWQSCTFKESKRREIAATPDCDVATFTALGLLLDSEADPDDDGDEGNIEPSALVQIFTRPLFDEDTFFLEVLERRGRARGFGAGNIRALAKSILLQQKEDDIRDV